MNDIFAERNAGYNLRHGNGTQLPKVSMYEKHMKLRLYPSFEIDFLYFTKYSQASKYLFKCLKTILNVGRARTAIV